MSLSLSLLLSLSRLAPSDRLSRAAGRAARRGFRAGAVALLLALAQTAGAGAVDGAAGRPSQRDMLPGPVEARVIRVQDGDSLMVRARCPAERELAEQARDFVVARISGAPVRLVRIRNGKYAGRVVAGIEAGDGSDVGRALIGAGLARPYHGGRRGSWCGG